MDKLTFISAQALKNTIDRQENIANNMANANTVGFREQLMSFRPAAFQTKDGVGANLDTRTFSAETVSGFRGDFGSLDQTGRALDLAVKGRGWFSVNTAQGEAYTRAGNFNVTPDGLLVDAMGNSVVADGGEIIVPQGAQVSVDDKGVISAISVGAGGQQIDVLGQLKIVAPENIEMERSADGYFRRRDGQDAEAAEFFQVASGFLEGSNVNQAEVMVQMIEAGRTFDMNMRVVSTAKENSERANSLLSLN